MSSRDVDNFLAESQEVLDDYVTWHGSADSATWAADGSHEPDQISGDYYGDDHPMPGVGLFQHLEPGALRFAPVGTPLPVTTEDLGEHWTDLGEYVHEVRIEPDFDAFQERLQRTWERLQAISAHIAEQIRGAAFSFTQADFALAPPPPVDVEIREDTLRELVPYDANRYADQPPPPPFAPFQADQPTGRAAQRSTYGGTR